MAENSTEVLLTARLVAIAEAVDDAGVVVPNAVRGERIEQSAPDMKVPGGVRGVGFRFEGCKFVERTGCMTVFDYIYSVAHLRNYANLDEKFAQHKGVVANLTYAFALNEHLALPGDAASALPGASVQEVDFSEATNFVTATDAGIFYPCVYSEGTVLIRVAERHGG